MGVKLKREEAIKIYTRKIKQSKTRKDDYAVLVIAKGNNNLTNEDIYYLENIAIMKIPEDKRLKKSRGLNC